MHQLFHWVLVVFSLIPLFSTLKIDGLLLWPSQNLCSDPGNPPNLDVTVSLWDTSVLSLFLTPVLHQKKKKINPEAAFTFSSPAPGLHTCDGKVNQKNILQLSVCLLVFVTSVSQKAFYIKNISLRSSYEILKLFWQPSGLDVQTEDQLHCRQNYDQCLSLKKWSVIILPQWQVAWSMNIFCL